VSNLVERVTDGKKREAVIEDCNRLLDQEVAAKSGLSGMAVKGAFKMVGAIKPGFTRSVIDGLLNDFLWQLQPYFETWEAEGNGSFGAYLNARTAEVVDSLLKVTDRRAEHTEHKVARKMYLKFRPSAVGHVTTAMPNVGDLIDRHLAQD
jgi:hypothetical protein